MLAVEDEHGIVERMHIAHGVFFSAFTLVVNHVHGQIPVVEAGLHYAIRQVNVFAIHEEIFVEAANVLQQICAAKHVSSRQNVNLARLKLRQEPQMIFGKKARVGKQRRQTEYFAKRYPRSGERAFRLRQKHAVAVGHVKPYGSALGVLLQPLHTLRQAFVRDYGVGVQNQCKLAMSLHYGLIVGSAEADIFVIFNENHIGEASLEKLHRTVAGIVVNHENLALKAAQGFDG